MNIRRDHVERLTVDYTEPEPEVLYVVATPSGYFILGQYLSFPRARRGKRSSLFARQVLNHGHTSIRDYLGYGSIDHRFSIVRREFRLIKTDRAAKTYLGTITRISPKEIVSR